MMEERPESNMQAWIPPRMLAGIAVMFWGAMVGLPMLGLLVAVLLEGCHWLKMRWHFDELAHVKAFQLSILIAVTVFVMLWVDGLERHGIARVLMWAPLYLLPVELAQRYGYADSMYFNTFFYFGRKRMLLDREEGREVRAKKLNTGYPYIGAVLIASCLFDHQKEAGVGAAQNTVHMAGVFAIAMACGFAVVRKRGMRLRTTLLTTPVVLALAWGIQWGIHRAYNMIDHSDFYSVISSGQSINELRSNLGRLGSIKQSPNVQWRVWGDGGSLLKLATYDHYAGRSWTYRFDREKVSHVKHTYELTHPILAGDGALVTAFRKDDLSRASEVIQSEGLRFRGSFDSPESSCVVPTARGYYAAGHLYGEGTEAENNKFGTMRLIERDAVMSYTLWADSQNVSQDEAPNEVSDLQIPEADEETIRVICDQLGLREMSDADKVETIRQWFLEDFTYSTHFDFTDEGNGLTKLEQFLTTLKKGHCEYFATAGAMLLREAGVPTRYCVGYAAMEKRGDTWLLRGTHAHAWCRAYIDNEWVDVDLTPPDWFAADTAGANPLQFIKDWVQNVREDFQIWRETSGHTNIISQVLGGVLLFVILLVAWRLWKAREKKGESYEVLAIAWGGEIPHTPLFSLEKFAGRHLGPRLKGQPLGPWLMGLAERNEALRSELEEAIEIHKIWRFSPEGVDDERKARLGELAQKIRKAKYRKLEQEGE